MRQLRMLAIFSIITASLWIPAAQATEASTPRELVILNWADYLDPELIAQFEESFDVKIREVYFETDDERDVLLLQSDGKNYDVAIVDGTTIAKYQKRGWLAKIDKEKIPNLHLIYDRWRDAHHMAAGYAVPYFWGTTGIAYRADLIEEDISSWVQLFNPPEAAQGRIAMIGDSRDLMWPALMALGHSPNSGDAKELEAAQRLLLSQKPHVRSYSYVSLDETSSLLTGKVAMALMYNGDALALQELNQEITYVVPDEGTLLWVDYLTILEASENKELAAAFINFMNVPENAARQAQSNYYATPNEAAEAYLPAEFLEDRLIYPPRSVIDSSTFYLPVPVALLRRYATIYSTVTR